MPTIAEALKFLAVLPDAIGGDTAAVLEIGMRDDGKSNAEVLFALEGRDGTIDVVIMEAIVDLGSGDPNAHPTKQLAQVIGNGIANRLAEYVSATHRRTGQLAEGLKGASVIVEGPEDVDA